MRSAFLLFVAVILTATPAYCDPLDPAHSAAASPVKSHATTKKPKSAASPDVTSQSLDQIQFSQPNTSPIGPQKAVAPPARSNVATKDPKGDVSLDLKWRATNDRNDPFDAVRHTSGPNGPGDAVEGGVKFGF
jgi:hypothetical protein